MKETIVIKHKRPRLKNPIFIEGLPGVGHVGKLVAEHLIEELGAKKIIDIFSPYFPPQVTINREGIASLVGNEIYAYKTGKENDLLILVGDHQSTSGKGHYELSDIYLDIAESFKVKRIYTLGGYGVGQLVDTDIVLGAANTKSLVKELKKCGVVFKENEPGGGIVGASGLLLGLSTLRDIEAACLMGVTSGYIVDPKSAQSVLKILCKLINIEVDMQALEERAFEMERIVEKLQEMERSQDSMSDDELRYIG